MPIVEQRYDQSRIDSLRRSLQREADKGKPRDYEILVDGFKIVPRTSDLSEFEDYEQEIRDATRNISFLLFDGPGTNRNTRYSFSFHHNQQQVEQPAATLGEIDQIVAQKLSERDRDYELTRLREKLGETAAQLTEAEEYADKLQERITQLEAEQKGKMLKLGDLGASLLMGLLRQNAHKLPDGLAGYLDMGTQGLQEPAIPQAEASYSRAEQLDDATHDRLALLQQMQQRLSEQQVVGIINIIGYLTDRPEQITTIIELIQNQ